MEQYCGTWHLDVSEEKDLEAYMKAVGVSEDKIQQGKKVLAGGAKLTHVISHVDDAWSIKVITQAGEQENVFPSGKPVKVSTLDGRTAETTYTLEGDGLVETQEGEGWKSRNVRKVNGDDLTMTFTAGNGVSCTRKYKREN